MDYFRRFTFLFAAPVFDTDDLEGLRFNQIITEIERSGFEVVPTRLGWGEPEDTGIFQVRCILVAARSSGRRPSIR